MTGKGIEAGVRSQAMKGKGNLMVKARAILPIALFAGFILVFLLTCGGGGGIDKKQDTDMDGMPDWWETTYGLNPLDPSDADKDPDRDGWTNLEEYQNGTDPQIQDPPKELCNGLDDDGNGLTDEIWLDKGTPCEMCGIYQCSADGLSLECQGQGICSPGDNKNCGSNGMKTCLDTCVWGYCYEPLQCTVGEQQTSKCGYCEEGLQTRTCGFNGLWEIWSDCLGRGCRPATAQACEIEGKAGTQKCSDECQWGDCVANCNPGDKFTASCGDCGGTHNRTCRSDGTWSGWDLCRCVDQTESKDFPGYEGQTRTCGQASQCEWNPWTNCTLDGAECDADEVETQACGCGSTGIKTRTCSEICTWGDWGDCQGDLDGTPPSTPDVLTPEDGNTFYALPITFSWLPSTDNCGLSNTRAYEISLEESDQPYAQSITIETGSSSYELISLPGGRWRWWVRAKDEAGNASEYSLGRGFSFYPEEISHETFDSPTMIWNWTAGDENSAGGNDYWGKVDTRANSDPYSLWCAAGGDQSDDECDDQGSNNVLASSYDNDMAAFLEMLLDFRGHSHLTLSFWYWLEVADAKDCLKVRVKGQSGIWTEVWTKCENSNGWTLSYLDLSAYAGQANVTLQFRFESDGAGHCAEGAYIDDIVVEGW